MLGCPLSGTLDCSVASEEPADQDFGSAALKISKLFKMRPQARDGVAGHLRRYGPVRAALAPVAPLFAEGVA